MSSSLYDLIRKKYYLLGLIFITFFFFLSLYNTYTFDFSLQAIISDSAIFGLMAQDLKEGETFPFFYYGQNYMGPFCSIFIWLFQLIFDLLQIKQMIPSYNLPYSISPMALQLACIFQFYLGHLFWALGAKKIIGAKKSLIFFLILCAGQIVLTQHSLRPIGAGMAYFFSALTFYLYYKFNESPPIALNRLSFGLLFSLSLWANQTSIFVWGGIFLHYFFQSDLLLYLKANLNCKKRLNLSKFPLQSGPKIFLRIIFLLLAINFIVGVIVSFYFGVFTWGKFKIPNGFSHIKTSCLLFIAIQLFLETFYFQEFKKLFKCELKKITSFLYGVILGQMPLLIGRVFNLYEKSYTVKFKFIMLSDYPAYLKKFFTHYIPHILSGDSSPIYWPVVILLLFFFILVILKEKKAPFINSLLCVPILIFILNLVYLLLGERAREQYAFRYGILMIPTFYLVLLGGVNKFSKKASYILYCLIFIVFILFNRQRMDVIKSVSEVGQFYKEEIKNFKINNTKTCFANYWDAYRLEFLTGRNVVFLPYQSQDRTPQRTKQLSTNTKCYYLNKVITTL